VVAPIIGALLTFAGFFMVVVGTRKEEEFGSVKPVATDRKVEVTKKADMPATAVGAEHHEGIYHGV